MKIDKQKFIIMASSIVYCITTNKNEERDYQEWCKENGEIEGQYGNLLVDSIHGIQRHDYAYAMALDKMLLDMLSTNEPITLE